jgi:hypothetical protein
MATNLELHLGCGDGVQLIHTFPRLQLLLKKLPWCFAWIQMVIF